MRNKEKGKQKIFYVYVYLDTTKPGRYTYEGLEVSFLYEPFYVGKGHGDRYLDHIRCDKNNKIKISIILKIRKETGNHPGIIKIEDNMNEHDALEEEKRYIKIIKRSIDGGPLTNKSTGGRGGGAGVVGSFKTYIFVNPKNERVVIHNLSKFCRDNDLYWNNMYSVHRGTIASYKGYRKYIDETSLLPYTIPRITTAKNYTFINPNGDKITIFNLTQFCKDNDLCCNSMMRLNRGKITYHKAWRRYVEGEEPFDINFYAFINPEGSIIKTFSMVELSEEYGLNPDLLSLVHSGKNKSHRGWTKYPPAENKKYIFLSPDKEKFITESIKIFSEEHGLNKVSMSAVHLGKRPHHRGWTKYIP